MSMHSHPPLTFPRILGDVAQSPILQMIKPEAPGQTAGAQRRRNSNPGPRGWQISALPPALHTSSLDLSKKQSYLYEARDKEMHQWFFQIYVYIPRGPGQIQMPSLPAGPEGKALPDAGKPRPEDFGPDLFSQGSPFWQMLR